MKLTMISAKALLGFAVLGAAVVVQASAFADPGKNRGHKNKNENAVRVHSQSHDNVRVVIADRDRDTIRSYLRGKSCPPGLAKKNNGCLPPGHAKRYNVGDVLVLEERPRTIWQALADMISPPPSGHRYIRTDSDVLLVSERNNRIVDIVTLD